MTEPTPEIAAFGKNNGHNFSFPVNKTLLLKPTDSHLRVFMPLPAQAPENEWFYR